MIRWCPQELEQLAFYLPAGQGATSASALQSSAIDNVVQQILAGVTTSAKETEAKKRELNKV